MKNALFFFTVFSFSALFLACNNDKFDIGELIGLQNGKEITVTGYFSMDPVAMIVADTIWLTVNTPMPDDQYVLLRGKGLEEFLARDSNNTSFGAFVTVKGTFSKEKGNYDRAIETNSIEINGTTSGAGSNPPIFNLNNALFPQGPIEPNKFALLYSGGKSPDQAKNRYWNDLAFMYNTLKSKYGYSDDNIVVVYKDGVAPPGNDDMIVDFAASESGLNDAISSLNAKMNQNPNDEDYLFVFTTNHGGGYLIPASSAASMRGGIEDAHTAFVDEIDPAPKVDETIFYFVDPFASANQPPQNEQLLDEQFAAKINTLPFKQLITFHEPCFSGGMLWDFKPVPAAIGSGAQKIHINIAASGENEYSYSYSANPISNTYDAFSYHFTAALNGATHIGNPLPNGEIPANYDGRPGTSVWEAFWYARKKDVQSQHPLDDNADGIGTHFTNMQFFTPTAGSDGFNAAGARL